jgi:hypothetical protein
VTEKKRVKKDGYGRLEKEKMSDCVTEGKIVFLLHSVNAHSTNTTPNLFIKQGHEKSPPESARSNIGPEQLGGI